MAKLVVQGAMLKCSFGSAPASLVVVPTGRPVTSGNMPAATIQDFKPVMNIATFGSCSAPTNPAVIAAAGSPVPCVPVIVAPWAPGAPMTMINGQPALTDASKCACSWLGIIEVSNPGGAGTVDAN